jgi:hypothetical protein
MSFLSSGETAVALFDFEPTESDEIELSEGDVVVVLARQEDDWWLVLKGTQVGLVPSTHVAVRAAKENAGGSSLPPGWDSWIDPESGDTYYCNEMTGIV